MFKHPSMNVLLSETFYYVPRWLSTELEAELRHDILKETTALAKCQKSFGSKGPYWNRSKRMVRLGDADVTYTYKGKPKPVHAWTPAVKRVKDMLQVAVEDSFNCVCVNYYDDEEADLYPHTDTKYIPQLGDEPLIACVSFGATRDFVLKPNDRSKDSIIVPLGAGDLFIMMGRSQADWKHGLPKAATPVGQRISLTFRRHM